MSELLLAKSDGTLLMRLELGKRRSLCIGRSPRCDVVVPTPTVSRRHALLFRHPRGWRMVDLGSRNGLHIEGGQKRMVELTEDRWIRIGAVHFWLIGDDDVVPTPPLIDAELLVRPDRAEGPVVSVFDPSDRLVQRAELLPTQEVLLIGSNPACDLVVDHPSIGGVHLVLYREGRRWCVAPGGDAPPTDDAAPKEDVTILVDGHRTRRRRLNGGMIVRMGDHRVICAGSIRPTEEAQAPSVAEVMQEWRKAQLEGTDHAGTELHGTTGPTGGMRPASDQSVLESPDSAISAFLGESSDDDD